MNTFPYISNRHREQIIDLKLAKRWLRMDIPGYNEDDEVIASALDSVLVRLETKCNLSLGVSTYTWNTTGLPCNFKDVRYVKEIESITIDGELVPATSYKLVRTGPAFSSIQWIDVKPGKTTTIVFKAGFGGSDVPADLKGAIRRLLWEEFESTGDGVKEKTTVSDSLLSNYCHPYVG